MRLFELTNREEEREYTNPVNFDKETMMAGFDAMDDVDDALVRFYLKANKKEKLDNVNEYVTATRFGKEKLGKVQNIPISKIYATEELLYEPQLKAIIAGSAKSSSDMPILYKIGAKYVVGDGNHRIAAALLNKEKSIKALVLDSSKILKLMD